MWPAELAQTADIGTFRSSAACRTNGGFCQKLPPRHMKLVILGLIAQCIEDQSETLARRVCGWATEMIIGKCCAPLLRNADQPDRMRGNRDHLVLRDIGKPEAIRAEGSLVTPW